MENRIKFTENEKLAMTEHVNADRIMFMGDHSDLNTLVEKENARKLNAEIDKYTEAMNKRNEETAKAQDELAYDINQAEIKPMFARVLIKPFKQNPFQRMKVENGIIVDAGGYTPHTQLNPMTGKYEEQKEFIVTGAVVEVGPDVKYLKEGDAVYYRIDTVVPVPFFKQGLVSLSENQVIAVVGEGLTARFNEIND